MTPAPPSIDARGSGVVNAHVVVSGYAAAMIGRLVPGNWREWLRHGRVAGHDLRRGADDYVVKAAQCSVSRKDGMN
jgi:hypothetical protein